MQYPKTGIGTISESDIIVDADWWRGGICPLANACCFLSKYVWKSADGMAAPVFLEHIRLTLQRDRVYTVSGVHDLSFCCSLF